jgi:acyl-coenzyme A synthetase/AMP-(fatty) acid ligase
LRHATVSVAEVGACCIIPPPSANVYDHLQTIAKEEISILTANPAFYRQFILAARRERVEKISSLRLALTTGNQLSKELRDAWKAYAGVPLHNYYGLTETSGICIAEPLKYKLDNDNSIGVPIDCLIKVVDDDGEKVSPDVPGELCVLGSGVFHGYYNNDKATAAVLKDGWFYTGDLVIQHKDGSLSLCGRRADIIKLPSGERVETVAIEEVMEKIPDLQDWAVCPVRRLEKEYFAVFFVTEPSADFEVAHSTIKQAISALIGAYAVPAIIQAVSQIPRGNHNKVLRNILLDTYFQHIQLTKAI